MAFPLPVNGDKEKATRNLRTGLMNQVFGLSLQLLLSGTAKSIPRRENRCRFQCCMIHTKKNNVKVELILMENHGMWCVGERLTEVNVGA